MAAAAAGSAPEVILGEILTSVRSTGEPERQLACLRSNKRVGQRSDAGQLGREVGAELMAGGQRGG